MYLIPAHVIIQFIFAVLAVYFPVLVRSLGYSVAMVGVILAIAEGAGILGPFLIGRLTDSSGRYKLGLNLSFFLTALPAIPLALFVHPVLSAIFVALIAIGHRSAVPLLEAITTISIGKDGNYGRIRVTGSIAFVAFALIMQWVPVLRPYNAWNISLWICISAVTTAAVISLLPIRTTKAESPGDSCPTDSPREISSAGTGSKSIWTPFFIMGLVCIALNRLSIAPIYSFISLFMIEYMDWHAVGFIWALGAMAEIPFIYLSHRLIRRFGTMPVLAFTGLMLALRLAVYALFPFKAGVIAGQLLHSFCFGLFHPAAIVFISRSVPPHQRSFGMTLYMSLGSTLPLMLGNFIGGFIVEQAGYRVLFGSFTIPVLLSVAIYLVGRYKFGLKDCPR
ncbi:MAG: MFS transporter [Treponema sp.]|nr:MFS transporter [Treponema sp.]